LAGWLQRCHRWRAAGRAPRVVDRLDGDDRPPAVGAPQHVHHVRVRAHDAVRHPRAPARRPGGSAHRTGVRVSDDSLGRRTRRKRSHWPAPPLSRAVLWSTRRLRLNRASRGGGEGNRGARQQRRERAEDERELRRGRPTRSPPQPRAVKRLARARRGGAQGIRYGRSGRRLVVTASAGRAGKGVGVGRGKGKGAGERGEGKGKGARGAPRR
jgi:hypothetical protein